MRGGATPQPLVSDDGDHLMWNGNVFGGCLEVSFMGQTLFTYNHIGESQLKLSNMEWVVQEVNKNL